MGILTKRNICVPPKLTFPIFLLTLILFGYSNMLDKTIINQRWVAVPLLEHFKQKFLIMIFNG